MNISGILEPKAPNHSNSYPVTQEKCYYFELNMNNDNYFVTIHIVTAVINSIFGVSAFLGNALIMYVIWTHRSLHTPSNALLGCLAFSDFLVGLLAQPAFVAHKIGELESNFELYCPTRITTETVGMVTGSVSLLCLTTISAERYIALKFHLRYEEIVTTTRIFFLVGLFWIITTIQAIAKIFVPVFQRVSDAVTFLIPVFCFVIIVISSVKILRCVVRHQKTIHAERSIVCGSENNKGTSFSILRYKKSTISMAYIFGFYLIFYVPFVVALLVKKFFGYTGEVKAAYICTSTLVFLNSSANPVVYCWRMTDVRKAVKKTLKKLRRSREGEDVDSITVVPTSFALSRYNEKREDIRGANAPH